MDNNANKKLADDIKRRLEIKSKKFTHPIDQLEHLLKSHQHNLTTIRKDKAADIVKQIRQIINLKTLSGKENSGDIKRKIDDLSALINDFQSKIETVLPLFSEIANQISFPGEAKAYTELMFRVICEKELQELGIIEDYQDSKALSEFVSKNPRLSREMHALQEKVTGSRFVTAEELVLNPEYFSTPEYKKFKQGSLGNFNFILVKEYPPDNMIEKGFIYVLLNDDGTLSSCKTRRMDEKGIMEKDLKQSPGIANLLSKEPLPKPLPVNYKDIELSVGYKRVLYDILGSTAGVMPGQKNTIYTVPEAFAFNEFVDEFDYLDDKTIKEKWSLFRAERKPPNIHNWNFEEGELKLNLSNFLNDDIEILISDTPKEPLNRKLLKENFKAAQIENNRMLTDLPPVKDKTPILVSLPIPEPIFKATLKKDAPSIPDSIDFMTQYLRISAAIRDGDKKQLNQSYQLLKSEVDRFNFTSVNRNKLFPQNGDMPEPITLLKILGEIYTKDIRPSIKDDKSQNFPQSTHDLISVVDNQKKENNLLIKETAEKLKKEAETLTPTPIIDEPPTIPPVLFRKPSVSHTPSQAAQPEATPQPNAPAPLKTEEGPVEETVRPRRSKGGPNQP